MYADLGPAGPKKTAWGLSLSQSITDLQALLQALELDAHAFPEALDSAPSFSLKVPLPYLARMNKGDPQDPLLRQVLSLNREQAQVPGFSRDPLNEQAHNPLPGVLHKYQGRALLILSPSCAIHCRYCFRRAFPYEEQRLGPDNIRRIINYFASRPDLNEVILSGGDPLMHQDSYLARLIEQFEGITHLKTLRIHSRLPVVIPERVTEELCQLLKRTRFNTVMVFHINHAQELDSNFQHKVQALKEAGVTLFNQSVLLKGVNDSVAQLKALSLKLFDYGILPYYLNILDKVEGSQHFEVSVDEARKLMSGLIRELPGYLMPRLVQECATAQAKVPISFDTPSRLA